MKKIFALTMLIAASIAQAATPANDYDALREALKQTLSEQKYFQQFGRMMAFETEPDISGSTFYIHEAQNTVLDIYKFPAQFKLFSTPNNDFYGRIGINYAQLKTDDLLDNTFIDNQIQSKWRSYSSSLGLMADFKLNKNFTASFATDLGILRMENRASYRGSFLPELAPVFDGILLNWNTNASIISTAAALKYTQLFTTTQLDIKLHYIHSYVDSFSESVDFQAFTANTDTLTIDLEITHPWHYSLMGYPLSGIVHLGHTAFAGRFTDAMGFGSFSEFGYSLQFDIGKENLPVKQFNLGIKGISGDNQLTGWSIIFGYRF